MFKMAETGARLTDAAFRKVQNQLRFELVDLQQRCRLAADFPVIIVLAGVQGAGVVDTLNLLNTWMDPRWIHTHAFDHPSDEERERPLFWRYWRCLPEAGTIGLFLDGWYGEAIAAACKARNGPTQQEGAKSRLTRIAALERTLADEGALIVKFWLHLGKEAQKKRVDTHRVDPVFGFRASDAAWPQPAPYDTYIAAATKALKATHTAQAPWRIIDGSDDNYRRARVLTQLRDAIDNHRKVRRKKTKDAAKDIRRAVAAEKKRKNKHSKASKNPLAAVDLSKAMNPKTYT